MGPDELQSFLKHEQCETHSLEECQELITTLTQDPNKVRAYMLPKGNRIVPFDHDR